MGIKNLNSIIEKYSKNGKTRVHLSNFSNLKIAIDTNIYLYKYLYGKNNHIDGIFFMVNKFKKFNIIPIFIFDGKPPVEKTETIKYRKLIKERLKDKISELQDEINEHVIINSVEKIDELQEEIDNIEKKIIYVNNDVITKTKQLFDYMGIAYIDADCEAEHYASKLCQMGIVDAVMSEDTDTLACGSIQVIRKFSNRDDFVDLYDLNLILCDLNLTYKSFVDICILLGNDYVSRPRGFNHNDIYALISRYRSIERIIDEGLLSVNANSYLDIRKIINLETIEVDKENISNEFVKKKNLNMLKSFLKENSDIEEKIYLHRINMIFFNNYYLVNNKYNRCLVRVNKKIENFVNYNEIA